MYNATQQVAAPTETSASTSEELTPLLEQRKGLVERLTTLVREGHS